MIVNEPSLPSSTDPQGKKGCFPSPLRRTEEAKISKGPSLPSDLFPSSSEALVIEIMVEVMAPLNLGVATLASESKATEGKMEGPMTIEET